MKSFYLILFLGFALPALAKFPFYNVEIDDSGSKVSATCPFSKLPSSGYVPAIVEVKNANNQELEIEVIFKSGEGYGYSVGGISGIHRTTLTAPANETNRRWVMIPVGLTKSNGYGATILVDVNSNSPSPKISRQSVSLGGNTGDSGFPFIAVSSDLYATNGSRLGSGSAGSKFQNASNNESLASFTPEALPADPRAYFGVDLLIISDLEWKALTTDIRRAITAWISQGGELMVSSPKVLTTPDKLGLETHGKLSASKYNYGLGHLSLITTDATSGELNFSKLKKLPFSFPVASNSDSPSSGRGSLTEAIKGAHSNRLVLIFVLLAFAVLVGPINLFVFAPAARRHRIFVTTPLIAIGTSLILALGVVISDGFGGEGSRVALVEIEDLGDRHYAHIFQEQAAHVGIAFGSDFTLEAGTSIKPFSSLDTEFSQFSVETIGSAKFDLITEETQDGTLAKGSWISSRSDVAHLLRNQRPERGSVRVSGDSSRKQVEHSLSYSLQNFFYRDEDGNIWNAESVPTGTIASLRRSSPKELKSSFEANLAMMSSPLKRKFDNIINQRGRFYATSSDFPMIETSDSIEWNSSQNLITGHIDSQP